MSKRTKGQAKSFKGRNFALMARLSSKAISQSSRDAKSHDTEVEPSGPKNKIAADEFNRELYRVRASRFADIFPNEVIIREKSISVVRNSLMMSQIETWSIEDIGEITLIDTPIFCSLELIGKFPEHKLTIAGLPKQKAQKAKEIIDGLTLEDKDEVDIPTDVDAATRRSMLSKAGALPRGIKAQQAETN